MVNENNNNVFKKYPINSLNGLTIGVGITGSFCTLKKLLSCLEILKMSEANIIPIFSNIVSTTDNRFMSCQSFTNEIIKICGNEPITTITAAEPIGPKAYLDIMLIAPCTGNTLAKLTNGITDTPVLMAAKAHLRNQKPLVLSISTNDALGINFKNIGQLINMKNIYLVPFTQDDPIKKPNSLISDLSCVPQTLICALNNKQIEPVIL